ncbi:hypothetical protein [Rhizobium leguminosarum]|uniref:hypothetical protein n=1 Tax=Rhizobium leguminosarum TaxID=384 RepID=UPI001C919569|nr:hypothetical protein [Rhizobium leguminosarum]MBY2914137.1 hypothetical protein [Rhizobium leguminosarum]MBY2969676.1 hypothetical protein [Rhizobium leguminosarum]MBY2977049.1 hypothetical protein [Rhizobium leguminosarum]MBY3005599.1 hypothetical protein [Rhizobium leguminosarum]
MRLVSIADILPVAVFALSLAAAHTSSANDDWNPTIHEGLFNVTVVGKKAGGDPAPARVGKAFAIGPNLLVTSSHVVGSSSEWEPAAAEEQLARAIRPLQRTISVQRVDNSTLQLQGPLRNILVVSPDNSAMDAAGLSVASLKIGQYFKLSMCDIMQGADYWVILTKGDPTDPDSLLETIAVQTKAVGMNPDKFGPLYIFETSNDDFAFENNGHDGSPILDGAGNVVAVVSALVMDGGRKLILGTPTQPMFPGVFATISRGVEASNDAVKCSLADTVKRINSEVSTHAAWTVDIKRDDAGRVKFVTLSYESVSEKPNVDSVKVRYEFNGKNDGQEVDVGRLYWAREVDDASVILEPIKQNPRQFSDEEIGKVGHDIIEKGLKTGGYIQSVRLYIMPNFKNDDRERPAVVKEFPWIIHASDVEERTVAEKAH